MADLATKKEVLKWVYKVTGEPNASDDFYDALRNGVLLCKLLNKTIGEGTVTRINTMQSPFKIMENISAYIGACRKIGVREADLFTTVDLFEGTGLNYVVTNIVSLARIVKEKYNFPGPHLTVMGGAIAIEVPSEAVRERPRSHRADTTFRSNNKKFCDSCGRKNLADSKHCLGCGSNLEISALDKPIDDGPLTSSAAAATAAATTAPPKVTVASPVPTATKSPLLPVQSAPVTIGGGAPVTKPTPPVAAPVVAPVSAPATTSTSNGVSTANSSTEVARLTSELNSLRFELGEAQAAARVAKKKVADFNTQMEDFKNQFMAENNRLKESLEAESKAKKAALDKANQFAAHLDAAEEQKARAIEDCKRDLGSKESERVLQAESQANNALQKAEKLASEVASQKKTILELQNLKRHLEEEHAAKLREVTESERSKAQVREKALQDEIDRAKDAAKKIQAAVESSSTSGDEKDKKIASLQALLNKANEEITAEKNRNAKELDATVSNLKKTHESALTLSKNHFETKTAQLETKLQTALTEKNDLQNQIEELIMLGGSAAEGHAELQSALSTAQSKLATVEEERNSARLQLNAAKEELTVLKLKAVDAKVATDALKEAAQVATRLSDAEYALKDALALNNTLKKQNQDLVAEVDVTKKRVEELSQRIANGSQSNSESAKRILELEKEAATAKETVKSLTQQIAQSEKDLTLSQDRLADAVSREEGLAASLQKKHADVTRLEAELQSTQLNFDDILASRKGLESDVGNLRKSLTDLQKKFDTQTATLTKLTEDKKKDENLIKTLEAAQNESKKTIDDLKKKATPAAAPVAVTAPVAAGPSAADKKVESLTAEVEALKKENAQLKTAAASVAASPAPATTPAVVATDNKSEKLAAELEALKKENTQLKAKVNAAASAPPAVSSGAEKRADALAAELENVKRESAQLKSKVADLDRKLQAAQAQAAQANAASASAAPAPAPSSGGGGGGGAVDERYAKYDKMKKMLPEGAVRQKMMQDGFSDAEIDAFWSGNPLPSPAPAAGGEGGGAVDERYAKYEKMKKMLPEGAVRQKMTTDGFSNAEIDGFFNGKILPPSGGGGGGGGGRVDLMAEIQKGKRLKKAAPQPKKPEAAAGGGGGGGGGKGGNPMAGAMNIGQLVALKAQLRKDRSEKLETLLTDRSSASDLKDKNIVKDGGNIAAGIAGLKLRKTSTDLSSKLKERPAPETLVTKNVLKKVDKSALK